MQVIFVIMKYYLHDSNSFQDEKITELFVKFGYEGLGLFYTILEKLSYYEVPVKTTTLKHQLKVGKKLEKCWKFIEEIGLISSVNGETFNENLLRFSEKYRIKKEKNKKRNSVWRKNQQNKKNVIGYEKENKNENIKEDKKEDKKENKNVNIKEKKPPTYDEFEIFAIEKAKEHGIDLDLQMLKLKYDAWKTAGWVTGNSKSHKIKNWKSTLLNTLKFLGKEKNFVKKEYKTGQFDTYDDEAIKESDWTIY